MMDRPSASLYVPYAVLSDSRTVASVSTPTSSVPSASGTRYLCPIRSRGVASPNANSGISPSNVDGMSVSSVCRATLSATADVYPPSAFINASRAAPWTACHGVRFHVDAVALVIELLHPGRVEGRAPALRVLAGELKFDALGG